MRAPVIVLFIFLLGLVWAKKIKISTTTEKNKIVGGVEATPHEFPHQVFLRFERSPGVATYCGGSLISPEWILTASHCTVGVNLTGILVSLGVHNYTNLDEPNRVELQAIDKIEHENFAPTNKTLANDIALVKIDPPSDLIKPGVIDVIQLPEAGEDPPPGTTVTITGWGKTSDQVTPMSNLMKVDVPVMSFDECRKLMNIDDDAICISTKGKKGACQGDSGGPMNWDHDGMLKVAGATSFSINGTCEGENPVVFARVSHFRDWIKEKSGV